MKYNLNEEQLSAVMSTDDKILCLAGAGTGKSTTMLVRISHLVEQGVDPLRILALTFTNAAAFEMKDRYIRDHGSSSVPEFRTFHGFCYHILATDELIRRSLGYVSIPAIADDNRKKSIIREAQSITGIKSTLESIEKKKTKTLEDEHNYNILRKTTNKLMRKRQYITFDELCRSICTLFTDDSLLIQKYKRQYEYIFVDEFQDTDPLQYDFVKSFIHSKLFVVGDALQAIYGFRGADSSIIKKLSSDPEWTTIKLFKNYRSTSNICDFANLHSKHADVDYRVDIQSGNDTEGESVSCETQQLSYMYGVISKECIDKCIDSINSHEGDAAILCRTNKEVDSVCSYLDGKHITHNSNKKSLDIVYGLRSVSDNNYLLDWLTSSLTAEDYSSYVRVSALKDEYTLKNFLEDFKYSYGIAEKWNIVISMRRICRDSNLTIVDRAYKLLDFINCSCESLDESRCGTVADMIQYVLELYSESDSSNHNIYVGTIHSVKGLEFDNVYVLGVDNTTFKLNTEENKNLYYVAITRAKKHLTVFERGVS